MVKAIWNGVVVAESDNTVFLEGNHYFPRSAVKAGLKPSETTSNCPWKGTAQYHTVVAGGVENEDAAWYYANPKPEAKQIKDHIAFWKGILVE